MKRTLSMAAVLAFTATAAVAQPPLSLSEAREHCERTVSTYQVQRPRSFSADLASDAINLLGNFARGYDPANAAARMAERAGQRAVNDWDQERRMKDMRERMIQNCMARHSLKYGEWGR